MVNNCDRKRVEAKIERQKGGNQSGSFGRGNAKTGGGTRRKKEPDDTNSVLQRSGKIGERLKKRLEKRQEKRGNT